LQAATRFRWRWLGGDDRGDVRAGEEAALRDELRGRRPRQVLLVLPQRVLVCHRAELPRRTRRRRGLFAFDIEPCLVGPIEDYHLTILPGDRPNRVGVVAIEHAIMRHWCEWLDRLFPGSVHRLAGEAWLLAGPAAPRRLALPDRELISVPGWLGWSAAPGGGDLLAAGIAREYGVDLPDPETAADPDAPLRALGPAALARLPNLRQGAYRQPRTPVRRHFGMAATLLTALLLGGLATYAADLDGALRDEVLRLQRADEARFRELFPHRRRIVNVAVQLQRELETLRSARGAPEVSDAGFLPLLAGVAEALANSGADYRLDRIQYPSGESALALRIATDSLETLQTLTDALRAGDIDGRLARAQEDRDGGFVGVVEVEPR